jgi:hypothetical protein
MDDTPRQELPLAVRLGAFRLQRINSEQTTGKLLKDDALNVGMVLFLWNYGTERKRYELLGTPLRTDAEHTWQSRVPYAYADPAAEP